MEDIIPFLNNVVAGKRIPPEKILQVAEHYKLFGGVSPINSYCRQLINALTTEVCNSGIDLPVYWGNRNWHPLLPDTLQQMAEAGIKKAVAFVTSAYSSYSSCRQYLENITNAQQLVGAKAPLVDKIRAYYNHPGFIAPNVENVIEAFKEIPEDRHSGVQIIFTAHSIPMTMSNGCRYQEQLMETCRLVASGVKHVNWRLVFQSRSGLPTQPWLEPDICEYLKEVKSSGVEDVIVVPIGFICDHMEVIYNLDVEAAAVAQTIGLNMIRAATVGTHPQFVRMICDLIKERTTNSSERLALGLYGPGHDICAQECCSIGLEQIDQNIILRKMADSQCLSPLK